MTRALVLFIAYYLRQIMLVNHNIYNFMERIYVTLGFVGSFLCFLCLLLVKTRFWFMFCLITDCTFIDNLKSAQQAPCIELWLPFPLNYCYAINMPEQAITNQHPINMLMYMCINNSSLWTTCHYTGGVKLHCDEVCLSDFRIITDQELCSWNLHSINQVSSSKVTDTASCNTNTTNPVTLDQYWAMLLSLF